MSAGLTSNVRSNDDVTIKVNDEDAKKLDKIYYTVTVDPKNANKFTVTVDVLKAIKDSKMAEGDTLYTYYTGILNENAAVYDVGKQDNKAYLEYSNNPHDNTTKNETPKKVVYDWTFKMEVNKVDGADNKDGDFTRCHNLHHRTGVTSRSNCVGTVAVFDEVD